MLLKQRLDCVPNYFNKIAENSTFKKAVLLSNQPPLDLNKETLIDFRQLLQHFIAVQKKHRFFKRYNRN